MLKSVFSVDLTEFSCLPVDLRHKYLAYVGILTMLVVAGIFFRKRTHQSTV